MLLTPSNPFIMKIATSNPPEINPQIEKLEEADQEEVSRLMRLFHEELDSICYHLGDYRYKSMPIMEQLKTAKGRFCFALESTENAIWKILRKRVKL